jgi:hypothetical protein
MNTVCKEGETPMRTTKDKALANKLKAAKKAYAKAYAKEFSVAGSLNVEAFERAVEATNAAKAAVAAIYKEMAAEVVKELERTRPPYAG